MIRHGSDRENLITTNMKGLQQKIVNAPDRPQSNLTGHPDTGRNPSDLIGLVAPTATAVAVGAQALLAMVIAEMMTASHPLRKRGAAPNLEVETPMLQRVQATLVDLERIVQVDVTVTAIESVSVIVAVIVIVTETETVTVTVTETVTETVTVTDTAKRTENATESEIVLENEKEIESGLDGIDLSLWSIATTTLGRSNVAVKMIFAAQPVTEIVRGTRGRRRCRPRKHLNPRKTPIL